MPKQNEARALRRSQLQHILANLSEGVILIDLTGAILWLNHAALDMHGCVKPEEIGGSCEEYAKRFVLRDSHHRAVPSTQFPLSRLATGEVFSAYTLELMRRGNDDFPRTLEFRGLVLDDPDDQPNIAVLFIVDTTGTVELDEVFDRFFSAKPVPAAILRLDDSRYVRVNEGFCEMTGFTRDDVLGRPFHEINVLHNAQFHARAIRAMTAHTLIRPQESSIRVSNGDLRSVIVSGQPVVMAGRPCMLFTFIDLETRKRTELSLRQSEERFAKAFRMAPVPMVVCVQSNWCVTEANGAYVAAVGRPRRDVIGHPLMGTGLHLDHKALRDIEVALDSNQAVRDRDAQLSTPDGLTIDGALSVESVVIQEEPCALFVIQDITERKRTEAELISAIEAVMKDATWFSRTILEKLAQVRHPQASSNEVDSLTPREHEVLELICNGQADAEIASTLKLSRNTVRNHVAALYGKIGVNRRSAAVIWGRARGFGTE